VCVCCGLLCVQPVGGAIRALVLAPTRELTAQIKAEAVKLLSPHGNKLGVQVSHLSMCLSVGVCQREVQLGRMLSSCSHLTARHWGCRSVRLRWIGKI
jgi:superfamily II DNA/RNA helicase